MAMTANARNKLRKLGVGISQHPRPYGPNEGQILLVGWGSNQGPIREAVDRARAVAKLFPACTSSISTRCQRPRRNLPRFHHVSSSTERRGSLRLRPACRCFAPRLLRTEDSRHQQNPNGLTWKVKEILDRARAWPSASPDLILFRPMMPTEILSTMNDLAIPFVPLPRTGQHHQCAIPEISDTERKGLTKKKSPPITRHGVQAAAISPCLRSISS